MSELDVLIENARIVDGSGKAPYKGSIGVNGGKAARARVETSLGFPG